MSPLYIARSPDIAARLMDGEMIVMSTRDSRIFTLSPVGTAIWQAADGRTPLSEIVESRVCAAFEVEAGVAYRDAQDFVDELAKHGILLVSDHPAAA